MYVCELFNNKNTRTSKNDLRGERPTQQRRVINLYGGLYIKNGL